MWEENQERMESETPREEDVWRQEKPVMSKAAMRLQKVETENQERLNLLKVLGGHDRSCFGGAVGTKARL